MGESRSDAIELLSIDDASAIDRIGRAVRLGLGVDRSVVTVVGDDDRQVASVHALDPDAVLASSTFSVANVPSVGCRELRPLRDGHGQDALVAGPPHLRWVACAPVIGRTGARLGALWAADSQERSATDDQLALLATLAAVVADELELRRAIGRSLTDAAHATAALDQKDRVTSRLSHDLRTPMTAILGFGELLKLEQLTDEGKESLDHVLSSGRKLLLMIDEILDLNRLARGEGELEVEDLSVRELAKVATLAQSSNAIGRGLRLTIDPSCAVRARADKARLQRVLINLLGTVAERAREGTQVAIAAATTSQGVQLVLGPEASTVVASRSFGTDDVAEDKRAGLTLARRLVEAMGGEVGLVGPVGASGAPTYWIRLPLPGEEGVSAELVSPARDLAGVRPGTEADAGGDPPSPPDEAASHALHRVLYIEDDPANQRLMSKMFGNRSDIDIVEAIDGGTGLEEAFGARRPSLVLLDLGLPDISGREVLARLKADDRTAAVPVVVLSGEAGMEHPAELRAAGAAAYVTKPFNVRELVDLVSTLLAQGEPAR